jgi:hypothetical protein
MASVGLGWRHEVQMINKNPAKMLVMMEEERPTIFFFLFFFSGQVHQFVNFELLFLYSKVLLWAVYIECWKKNIGWLGDRHCIF